MLPSRASTYRLAHCASESGVSMRPNDALSSTHIPKLILTNALLLCCCCGWRHSSFGELFFSAPNRSRCGGCSTYMGHALMVRVWHKKRVRGGGAPGGAHWCPLFWGMGGWAAVLSKIWAQQLRWAARAGGRASVTHLRMLAVPEAPASSN